MWTSIESEASRFRALPGGYLKAVPGGYLYEVANPWIFAPPRRYIVSEAQKAQLLAITVTPGQWAFITYAATLAWISLAVVVQAMVFGLHTFSWDHTIVSVAIASVPMYVLASLSLFRHLRRIRPILAAATPTTNGFTSIERVLAFLKAFTPGWLIFFAAVSAFGVVIQLAGLLYQLHNPLFAGSPLFMRVLYLAADVGLTVLFLMLLKWKRREHEMSA